MQFHERLFEVRKRSGMTQNDLAEKLDVSRQAISRWEMGTAKPDFENLIAISNLFDVSVDYLLKGSEDVLSTVPATSAETEQAKKTVTGAFWGKLWLCVIVAFFLMTIIFALGSMDLMRGMLVSAIIVVGLALLLGFICLIVWITRRF